MKSYPYKFAGIVVISLLFSACAPTLMVNTDYDRDADFSQYETFYWTDEFQQANGTVENSEPLFYNTLMKKRLKKAIEREMEGKGYSLSEKNPDLLVNARVVVEERNNQNYPNYSPYYWNWGYTYNRDGSEKEGDVVIELIDQNEQQLVWQGYASGVLETDTEDKQDEINKAVTMILSKYQYRADEASAIR